ncbi:MAG TPA: hydantoinase B/oxoprolinase family protein [Ktedonobacterales bacterium]
MASDDVHPARLEVFRQLFQAVAEEMGEALMRAGFSPNIKERRDYSCAVFDTRGELLAQAEHLPVHLGSMPRSVRTALDAFPALGPGDMVLLNDPYAGGTHLPDLTLVAPVYPGDRGAEGRGSKKPRQGQSSKEQGRAMNHPAPAFYVANRAHHADVGGIAPGSLSLARELYQEGIILPPVRICRAGTLDDDLLRVVLRNVRTPDERRGDLLAQIAANHLGARRLGEYIGRYGLAELDRYGRALQDYAERAIRSLLAELPDAEVTAEDALDDDGLGTSDVAIRLALHVAGDTATFDFTGSAPQVPGSLNAVEAITLSAVTYALRLAVAEDVPVNAGTFRPIRLIAPLGTVVNARPPAAVAGGNVETSQRIVDVALAALAQLLPNRIPAASQGTMNNVTFGGIGPGHEYAYYETLGGGSGAGPAWHGTSGTQVHMTNTLNTPVEAIERGAPVRITRYALRRGSGGAGRYRGGDGLVREYEFLEPAEVSVLSERRTRAPYGLAGGGPGTPGENRLRLPDGGEERLPGKLHRTLPAGARLTIATPGGGGWGTPDGTARSDERQ